MPAKANEMPAVGTKAPAFALKSGNGETVRLSGLKGKFVAVYFYPKDDTPGCTIEANEFQANAKAFEKAGAVIVGISPDSVKSHCTFAEKFGLTFTLLADEQHEVAEKYGVWVEKSMYGKTYMGVQRATFLVDPEGAIANVWPKVKPEGHAKEVLDAIKAH